MKISVVIPVYNSVESLPILFDEIQNYFRNRKMDFEVIFVNDASQNLTLKMLNALERQNENVKSIHLTENVGQQKALYRGLRHATGDYAVTIDDDLQHDIGALDALLESANAGADLVFGIYEAYGEKKSRELGSQIIGLFFKLKYRKLCGQRVSSLRLIHKSIYEQLPSEMKPFIYLSAELLPFSRKIENVNVTRRARLYGKSGYTLGKCIKIGMKLTWYYGFASLVPIKKKEAVDYETVANGRRG